MRQEEVPADNLLRAADRVGYIGAIQDHSPSAKDVNQKAESAISYPALSSRLLICALIDNLLFSHTESYEQIARWRRCDAVNITFRQRRSFPMAYHLRRDDQKVR